MREPPRLLGSKILSAVSTRYGIDVSSLVFLPVGNDSASYLYRIESVAGDMYVLKAREGSAFSPASTVVPRFLRDVGVDRIVAPLRTDRQSLYVDLDNFVVSLYPFIDGRRGGDARLTSDQWHDFGTLTRRVHSTKPPSAILNALPREAFVPSRRELVDLLEERAREPNPGDSILRDWAKEWRARHRVIHRLVEDVDRLGRLLSAKRLPLVLCHADLHTWNTLLDRDEQLWLLDWDEVVLAPRERDLMFVVRGIGDPQVSERTAAWFFESYGEVEMDPLALSYYRTAWAVQDITACGERVCLLPELGDESRHDALVAFRGMFGPGHIVEIARTS